MTGGGRAPSGRRPGTTALVLRPLGYTLIGLVWAAIGSFLLALYVGLGVAQVVWGDDVGPIWELGGESGGVGPALLLGVLGALLAGPVAWYLGCATWPLAALSAVYVVRALRPGFRGERLSFTTYALPGTTLGPTTATPVALSLLPVRRSRVTDVLVHLYARGWRPAVRDAVATLPGGVGWVLATVACSPHLGPGARVTLGAVALVLYGTTAVLLRGRRVTTGADRGERPATALSDDDLDARRRIVRRARERRLRRGSGRDEV